MDVQHVDVGQAVGNRRLRSGENTRRRGLLVRVTISSRSSAPGGICDRTTPGRLPADPARSLVTIELPAPSPSSAAESSTTATAGPPVVAPKLGITWSTRKLRRVDAWTEDRAPTSTRTRMPGPASAPGTGSPLRGRAQDLDGSPIPGTRSRRSIIVRDGAAGWLLKSRQCSIRTGELRFGRSGARLIGRWRCARGVLVRDVVNAADGWPVAEAAVWPPAVVVADE